MFHLSRPETSPSSRFDTAPRRLSDQIAQHLREEIYSGRLLPHQRLREVKLAERLSVSRAPLREAILLLRHDGLVEVQPNRGAFVVSFSDDEIREIFALRQLLEPAAARAAAMRCDPEANQALKFDLEEMSFALAAAEPLRLALAHAAFHRNVAHASGMPRLSGFISALCTQMLASHGAGYALHPQEVASLMDDHQPIVAAIVAGDLEGAERAMRAHFRPVEPMLEAYARLREQTPSASSSDLDRGRRAARRSSRSAASEDH